MTMTNNQFKSALAPRCYEVWKNGALFRVTRKKDVADFLADITGGVVIEKVEECE